MDMYKTEIDRLRKALAQAHTLLRDAQWFVHCSSFHPQSTMDNCIAPSCKATVETLRSLSITELE